MTKVLIIFFFVLAHYCSVGQINSTDDSLCNIQLELAKNDLSQGKYRFCVSATWDLPFSRMYDILDSLCKRYKLVLLPDPEPEHCTFNPFSCYSNFMDSLIAIKFGNNFKSNLIKQADHLFILRYLKDTIPYYHCDTQIKYRKGSEIFDSVFFANFNLSNTCRSKITPGNSDYNVSFIVDVNGRASNFKITDIEINSSGCKGEIQNELLLTAKRFKYWVPAILGNKKVACRSNLFIDILRRHIVIQ